MCEGDGGQYIHNLSSNQFVVEPLFFQLSHYRFSISWARILPDGTIDNINEKGIDYYNRLINTILKYDIIPCKWGSFECSRRRIDFLFDFSGVTIFHFDVPWALQNLGGWTNDAIVDHFVDYADLVFGLFGDRVPYWITINEPFIFCTGTYGSRAWLSPTVKTEPGRSDYLCGHNVLKAHAYAYRLYKKKYADLQRGQVGITLVTSYFYSDTTNDTYSKFKKDGTIIESDVKRGLEFQVVDGLCQRIQLDAMILSMICFQFGWFANPIFGHGDYPAVMRQDIDRNSKREGLRYSRLPSFTEAEIRLIRGSSDFMGFNYYTSRFVTPGIDPNWPNPSHERDVNLIETTKPWWKVATSAFLYSVPTGLGDVLRCY